MKLTKAQEKKIEKLVDKWTLSSLWSIDQIGVVDDIARAAFKAGIRDHKRSWVDNIIKRAKRRK